MLADPRRWPVYFIPEERGAMSLPAMAQEALAGGVAAIQLRLKWAPDDALLKTGAALLSLCRSFGRPLVVNDRPDIAAALGAEGVHLGQEDMAVAAARDLVGPDMIIGVSVSSADEAAAAEAEGADYVAVSPVFATPVKGGILPVGLRMVAEVKRRVKLPVIAIGGITGYNAVEVISAGADGLAVINAIAGAENPRSAAAGLVSAAKAALEVRR